MVALRPYQHDLIDRLRDALRRHRSVICRLPTGGGKSLTAAYMAQQTAARGKRVIFTAHRRELIYQTSETFKLVGAAHGVICPGYRPSPFQPIQVASIDTLKRRLHLIPPPDLLIPDECHHGLATGWKHVIEWALSGGALVVGLTATPWRLSGEGLGELFGEIVHGPEVRWLIDNGFLSDYRIFCPPTPDLTGVHTRMGDFNQTELETAVDKPTIVGDAVSHYRKAANGMKAIAYCVSRRHSEHTAAAFNSAGIPAAHIDGETEPGERKRLINDFASGAIKVLTNCDLLGEGLDLSMIAGRDAPIEAVILLRPTKSLTLHFQQIGRGMRPKPQPAIILDHAGNVMRMSKMYGGGLPDDVIEWTLDGRKKKKETESAMALRQCPQCYCTHRPADVCPSCGFVYVAAPREVEHKDGELVEVDAEMLRRNRKFEIDRARDREALEAIAAARGYKSGWVDYIIRAREKKGVRTPVPRDGSGTIREWKGDAA